MSCLPFDGESVFPFLGEEITLQNLTPEFLPGCRTSLSILEMEENIWGVEGGSFKHYFFLFFLKKNWARKKVEDVIKQQICFNGSLLKHLYDQAKKKKSNLKILNVQL